MDVVISGIGQSAIGKKLDRTPLQLTVDAVKAALSDAGLAPADIDGVASWPGAVPTMPGFSAVGVDHIINAFRLKPTWYTGGFEGPAQYISIANAAAAIQAGYCRHVICFRTLTEGSARARPMEFPAARCDAGVQGDQQFLLPFWLASPACSVATYAMRHFHRYGTTREQLGQVAINARRNAALNPKALFREPISLEQYLSARMISSPLCLYDCDSLTDASTAVIVSAADTAADLRAKPIRLDTIVSSLQVRNSWDQAEDGACYATGKLLWERSDYTRDDVDMGQIYDGFSFLTLQWFEALGFCRIGEGGQFLEGGHRIARDGELPINTNGGQIGAGRLHGLGYVHEAVLQLRGEAGERQLAGDRKVAVCTAGGGPLAMAMLLARD